MSATLRQKMEEHKALVAKAKAKAREPDLTAEDYKAVQEMINDAQVILTQIDALKGIREQGERVAQMENLLAEQDHEAKADDEVREVEWKSWGEFLKASWEYATNRRRDERLRYIRYDREEGHERKSLSGDTGASGGFLVPTQFMADLQALQSEDSIVRGAGATVIRMTNRQLALPVLDQTGTTEGEAHWFGGIKVYWEGEGDEKTESEPEFRKVNLVAKKMICLTHAGDELLDDAAISLADFLQSPMGFSGAINFFEDYNFLRGPGGNRPRGMVDAPATIALNRDTADTVSYPDLVDMLASALPSANLTWAISQSLMSDIIQITGPSGNPSYVWQPNAREGIPGFLLGYPVRWTEKLPSAGNKGDVLLFAPQYYVIGDRQRTVIDSTKYARWVYDETSWRAVHRVDGQPWLSAPITYIDGETTVSPFVVLDSTVGT